MQPAGRLCLLHPTTGAGYWMQKNDISLASEAAKKRQLGKAKKNLFLTLIIGTLIAVLAACGQAPNAEELPNEALPDGNEDVSTLEWSSAAIGYVDNDTTLDVSSIADGIVVTGSGADIWGVKDEFYYLYTALAGDGSLSLRLDELSAGHEWSKAGVMIRESLDPDAKNALIHISGANGSVFQARSTKGGTTSNSAGADTSAKVGGWMRISRSGNTLTGDLSTDGKSWTKVGSYEIPMQEVVLIGMAVTSHDRNATATAKFKDLTLRLGWLGHGDAGQPTTPQEPEPSPEPTPEPDPDPSPKPGSAFVLPPATLYVSPSGNDSNSGRSASSPLRTVTKAASMVRPGDVVYLRGGVYPMEVKFRTSGTASNKIVWASYPGEWAIFDGGSRRKGVDMDRVWVDGADHNVFANFEVRNGPRQGIYVINGANDNLFTGLVVHGNNGSGVQNANSSRNRYEYLTIYDNFDEVNPKGQTGQDADGIGMSSGDRNVISHVVSFRNSDDGIDAWKSTNTLIEYSVAHSNGRGSHGNGNGFKAGGGIDNYTTVRHSIAFNNKAVGFTNNSGRQITFVNNTSFGNGNYAFLGHAGVTFQNNLAPGGKLAVNDSRQQNNSWNLGINDARFASTSQSSPDFLALRPDSPAIDKGVKAGYEYSGSAPDLGALEYGVKIAAFVDLYRGELTAAVADTDYAAQDN